jgi:hypothetical protein
MRTYRAQTGPFMERPFYTPVDVDRICGDALREVALYPDTPGPVRIERFIEKRFGVTPKYEDDLPIGVLGYTEFGSHGVVDVHVSWALSAEDTRVAERLLNSTLAHEAGHGLLHAHLYAFDDPTSLFGHDGDATSTRILCREERRSGGYDGRWWELQANMAIGSLLLPDGLVWLALVAFMDVDGALGIQRLNDGRREDAIRVLADTFEVSLTVAEIRLERLMPPAGGQLTL